MSRQPSREPAKRTLVISPNWIGDAVMAQPLLAFLKVRPGQGPIDVIATPTVAPVWRAMVEVDTVIEAPFRHGALQWRERRVLAAQLRKRGYTEAYVLPNTLKFALIPWLARIKIRIGYLGQYRYGLLTTVHRDTRAAPRSMVTFYAALALPPLATDKLPSSFAHLRPRLTVSDVRGAAVRKQFSITAVGAPVIVFAPGAEFGSAKRWPAAHFGALALQILQDYPAATILLLGAFGDRSACDEIVTAAAGHAAVRNLAGETKLADAIALIGQSTAVVSNDSGLLHIASALNRPVIGLYGPTDPMHAPLFSDVAHTLYRHLACAPCKQRECPLGHHDCMRTLTPDMVWQPLRPMLG